MFFTWLLSRALIALVVFLILRKIFWVEEEKPQGDSPETQDNKEDSKEEDDPEKNE